MTTDFNYCVFTVFCTGDLLSVFNAVKNIHLEIMENKFIIRKGETNVEKYLNPRFGGAHLPEFCFWKSANYPDKVFFISNYADGMSNLCGNIQRQLKCEMIMCTMSDGSECEGYEFKVISAEGKERVILAYKEGRWVFYAVGDPLPFEDTELYKKKYVRDRLNNNIIYSYLLKNGIDFPHIDENITESFTVNWTEW